MDPMMASIMLFAGNFAPRGWAFCDGQLLPIAQYSALFSLIGTTYGGDGRTTFALPDLRGRVPIGPRTGPGLPTYREGERVGTDYNILNVTQIPSHNHQAALTNLSIDVDVDLSVSSAPATLETPVAEASLAAGNIVDGRSTNATQMYNQTAPDVAIKGVSVGDTRVIGGTVTIGNTGANQAVNNMQPSLGINYIIALQGIFPSRS